MNTTLISPADFFGLLYLKY